MYTINNYTTIHLWLNQICVGSVILLMTYLIFNMITGIDELKELTKHISCKCKCKFDSRKCNSNPKQNSHKCRCESKINNICEKGYFWNPATCSCENGKYLTSITDYSVITCDEIIEETKTISINFN